MGKSNVFILKRVVQSLSAFTALSIAALSFQNCSGYQMYDLSDDKNSASSCGDYCTSAVALSTSVREITLHNPDLSPLRVVEIGGYCDDADFANSEVEYQYNGGAWTVTGSRCDDLGRFVSKIPVPDISVAQAFALNIRLRVITNENLAFYSNSLSLTLAVYPQ